MKWFHSLRYRMLLLIGAIVLVMSTLVIAYNIYIYQMKDDQIYAYLERTLSFYTQELGESLSDVEKFLVSQNQMGEEFQKLENPKKEIDKYLAELELAAYYQDSIDSFREINGLFLYSPGAEIYQGCTGMGVSGVENTTIKHHVKRLIEQFENMDGEESGWFFVNLRGINYLVKILKLPEVYVGSWVRADKIFSEAEQIAGLDEGDFVQIYNHEGDGLKEGARRKNKKYVELTSEVEDKGFSIAFVMEEHQAVLDMENPAMVSTVTAIVGTLLLVAACWFSFRKLLMRPLNSLVNAMSRLKDGDLDAVVETRGTFEEFQTVNEAFEAMTKEIKQLKIDVYEEMLNKQNAELLYLQVQIDPHFLTNCMNLIRNLSLCGENEKVEEAAVYLSKYMRYSLTTSTVIPLERELEHVDSYWKLQKLRYGEQIDIQVVMEPELRQIRIPTMLIQTFVDNSVKHQVAPDEQLKIKIVITLQENEKREKYLNVFIKDNGEGFEEEILKKLKRHEIIQSSGREHIGVYNVFQRLEILYPGRYKLIFANGITEGAVVNMELPAEIGGGKGEER